MEQIKSPKTRGRPRAFDNEEALDRALKVFWTRGYEGASLNELTNALGINRPSLYAAFGNKEELFRKALARYLEGPVAYLREVMHETTARQVVEQFLLKSVDVLTDKNNPGGCMVVQGALSCGEGAAIIRQELINCRKSYEDEFCRRFEDAQAKGDLDRGIDTDSLAKYVATIHQGLSVQASSGATREELLAVVATVLKHWPSK